MPQALKDAGLLQGLGDEYAGRVEAAPYNAEKDQVTWILNPRALKVFSVRLAEKIAEVQKKDQFPVVLRAVVAF